MGAPRWGGDDAPRVRARERARLLCRCQGNGKRDPDGAEVTAIDGFFAQARSA